MMAFSHSMGQMIFLLTPLREGRQSGTAPSGPSQRDFYSRPCGRGDPLVAASTTALHNISTHAPAGGATVGGVLPVTNNANFYSRPCGRGDQHL